MIFRSGFAIRRLFMALAALQLSVTIAVPLAEARVERSTGPASIEQQHSQTCVTLHKPSACVLCQQAATRAHPGRAAALPEAPADLGYVVPQSVSLSVSRLTSHRYLSRGPPTLLG